VLDRHALVERRGRVRRRAQGTLLSRGQTPYELWCTDYKGEFLLGNRQYCYPLTVADHASCFLLTYEALSSTKENYALTVFERLFKERVRAISLRCFGLNAQKPRVRFVPQLGCRRKRLFRRTRLSPMLFGKSHRRISAAVAWVVFNHPSRR
jgi:hypothetical protein